MARSKKDGRGGHKGSGRELWSRRCPKTNMWSHGSTRGARRYTAKTITHRFERREGKRIVSAPQPPETL